eukprot:146301-Prorocentrum_lima.AAC.1
MDVYQEVREEVLTADTTKSQPKANYFWNSSLAGELGIKGVPVFIKEVSESTGAAVLEWEDHTEGA